MSEAKDPADMSIEELREALEQAKNSASAYKGQVTRAKNDLSDCQGLLATAQSRIAELEAERDDLQDQFANQGDRLAALGKRIEDDADTIKKLQRELAGAKQATADVRKESVVVAQRAAADRVRAQRTRHEARMVVAQNKLHGPHKPESWKPNQLPLGYVILEVPDKVHTYSSWNRGRYFASSDLTDHVSHVERGVKWLPIYDKIHVKMIGQGQVESVIQIVNADMIAAQKGAADAQLEAARAREAALRAEAEADGVEQETGSDE